MFVIGQDNDKFINLDNVNNIYVKGEKIAVSHSDGSGTCIGQYQTSAEAKAALLMIFSAIDRGFNARVPSDESVKGVMANQHLDKTGVHHYADGKKSKGHGGS